MAIYCGNNQFELNRGKRLGTPYECLKQGVGIGLHSSLKGYNPQYAPIHQNTDYCGTAQIPPVGRTMGTPTRCLMKGIGVGKKLQYERGGRYTPPSIVTIVIILIIIASALIAAIIIRKWWMWVIAVVIVVSVIIYSYLTNH
jgi:hypothetical protein